MKQENLASGYIKLYRAITQHPIFSAPQATYFKIWTFLILNAAWRAHPVYLGGPIVPRGGLFIGARKLSEECNVPYHVTRLCLDRLVKEGMIEILAQKAAHLGSLITITNYETYQSDNEQDGALSGAAAAQRRRNQKKVKKVKKVKKNTCPMGKSSAWRHPRRKNHTGNARPTTRTCPSPQTSWNSMPRTHGTRVARPPGAHIAPRSRHHSSTPK